MQYQEEQDYTKRFDLSIWRRILVYAKPFYRHLAAIAVTMLLCAGFDVVFPLLTREAIDGYVSQGRTDGLGFFALKYMAVAREHKRIMISSRPLTGVKRYPP